ncbi:hypothetical protein [Streptomyces sp. NPDC017949]|uniref:hypothetical protein n=1 Tax=Streptomyces sp. NPDC017949 TaxID=3365020 RepID=UPI0037BDB67B
MHGTELATTAMRMLTGDGGGTVEGAARQAKIRMLVEDRLRRSALGTAALDRLRDEPGESAASIAVPVLADEIARDSAYAALLSDAVSPGAHAGTAGHMPPLPPPPPPVHPPRATTAPRPSLPGTYRRQTWFIGLLGLPLAIVSYVLLSVLNHASTSSGGLVGILKLLLILTLVGGPVASVAWSVSLLRRFTSPPLLAAAILSSLLLLRVLLIR